MNGEVNGTIGASMEASDNPPLCDKIVSSEEYNSNESTESHSDNRNNSKKSNPLNESAESSTTKSNGEAIDIKQSYGDNSSDSYNMDQKDCKDPLSNHSSNSNESCSNSLQSSIKNKDFSNNLNSKDAHDEQTYDKTDTNRTGVSLVYLMFEKSTFFSM